MTALPTDPARNLRTLLRCASVTPEEAGALDALEAMLEPLGFTTERPVFSEPGTPEVENLLATRGSAGRHLAFAGHTDVVPPGEEAAWRHPPFGAVIEDGVLYGRGAVDMKGGIACFVAALARLAERGEAPDGRISFLVTGDEEGPAVNGTVKLLAHAAANGQRFDACLVGEPTNPDAIGDMIKIGRRGSLSGKLTIAGVQGHVAYPHRALNPARALGPVIAALQDVPLDSGTADFQPSNLEIVSIDTGNPSANVIPAKIALTFNVRFNDRWSAASLAAEIERRARAALPASAAGHAFGLTAAFQPSNADAFLTPTGDLTRSLSEAIESVTGRRPELSTSGGTSDARFIKEHCPVVEFGLVGRTMHMVDERVALEDLETLTAVYEAFVLNWFAGS